MPGYCCVTIFTDLSPVEFCLGHERPTGFKAIIFGVGIVLSAAAMAACVTVISEGIDAAYLPAHSKAARNSGEAHIVGTAVPAATAYFMQSPFARESGLLFLSEPVGSQALLEGFTPAERPLADTVITALEQQDKTPLPRPRPSSHTDIQAKIDTVVSPNVANAPETLAAVSPSDLSGSLTYLQKLFHFWQSLNETKLPPGIDSHTAVYDIEGHVVYLPDGEKLEAHSGMGKLQDDLRYVSEKGRGPTPPNVYRLALRKTLFHGVQAIRLSPVDGSKMYGRDGILAHPYMLGPEGQSNGCVSVQDYPKFLEAYLSGKIDRLIVVPKLADAPAYAENIVVRNDKRSALQ
jgi:hypothetical protein